MITYLSALLSLYLPAREDDERGASAVEYGLLIAGIAAIIAVAVFALGPVVASAFSDTCESVNNGVACPAG
ncbi:Flp family type IVb pilin [Nocardioides sp. GY 10127]|uniref:Flp family type IVb pilin n=1 Tax=Nocardioides sp. GY 10127 TaxID=2569762 RepID=UPI0010A9160F|nr:Flp family type IVb pilin [Nocardioides sp. GY 10127]TIC80937.1 Flp family type IVb pilin [Nocardioides sp. GY 10127]